MSTAPPPIRLPAAVRRDLEAHRAGLADETERMLLAHARPCVKVTARRVSSVPLHRGGLGRLLGRSQAEPILGQTESKLGGRPYSDPDEDWRDVAFLGQLDLAAATAVLPPSTPRLRGLLRLVLPSGASTDPLRARWFPEIDSARACDVRPMSVGKWETRLDFALGWTLPDGDELAALWPIPDQPLHDYDELHPAGYNTDANNSHHRLLGHRSEGLDRHYGFEPPAGHDEDIAHYELLLRITFDNEAGFDWGSNWMYVIVARDDLARGDLSRIVVTGANS